MYFFSVTLGSSRYATAPDFRRYSPGQKHSRQDRRPAGGGVEEVRGRQFLILSQTDSDVVVDARAGGSLAVVLREFRLQEGGGRVDG